MPPRRHLILTGARSGSNFLVDTLNEHPDVVNYGETLYPKNVARRLLTTIGPLRHDLARYLDIVTSSRGFFETAQAFSLVNRRFRKRLPTRRVRWSTVHTIGVKEFAYRLDVEGATAFLTDTPDLAVVSLVREGLLERVISMHRLYVTGTNRGRHAPPPKILHVDPDVIIGELRAAIELEALHERLYEAIPDERRMRILYDDLMGAAQPAVIADVFEFLGVEPLPVVSQDVKVSPRRLRDGIENYDELVAALGAAGLGHHVPDEGGTG